MAIKHGVLQNASNTYKEENKPASHVYNNAGVSLQQYSDTRESQYLDMMRNVWGMIDKGAQAINKYIDANW